ncbi:MAG: ATP-dependent helicase [Candidatus Heimdallarchaeaceae archaeon]
MSLHYLTEPSKPQEIFAFLAEEIKEWFLSRFPRGFTPPQLYAIPSIHAKQNTLIFSSTGSGKTFAAFLAGINELFIEAKKGALKDQIYILYISPLKALGNDIRKNLEEPLQEIQDLAALKNIPVPRIRVHVRTGDTTQTERTKMLKKPPHILITTPESLGLILTSPKFSLHLRHVRWIIVDEIHEVSNNKRGVLLSLFLEYLQNELIEGEVTRIGLSATQAPIEEIARFLVGRSKDGKMRECHIANIPPLRKYDLAVLSPVKDILHTPYTLIQEGIYSKIADLIVNHETSIIFTNTRRGAESVAFKLKERLGEDYAPYIAVHHSSLSRDTRLDVEDRLKNNELLAVVSSTSLELGIDIGSVELVGQIGSPKSVAKYLQRVGRSGHSITEIAKGRLIVTDRDDAVECAVLTRSTYLGDIDRVQVPKNCLDVLAQFIVGISLVKRWDVDEVYELVKCSYNYSSLPYKDYIDVLEYLGGYKLDVAERKVYRKIWYDKQENAFGKKRNSRLIFYTNIGTIPENTDYYVELETYRTRLGKLSESFVERLTPGDIFVLGSHTYQFKRTAGSKVIVGESLGKRPTVPSWIGEMLPRSFELSQQIGKFIVTVAKRIQEDEMDIQKWIESSFLCDNIVAKTIIDYVREQLLFLNEVPSDKTLLVESFMDPQNRLNIVFHAYFGRRVNDALSRAYAYAIGKQIQSDVASAVNDNGFLLILPSGKMFDTEKIPELVTLENLEKLLKEAIRNTELFQTRFRHVANRSLMILRNSGKRPIPVSRQNLYARRILDSIKTQDDFCVVKETFREILRDYMDLENAAYILSKIKTGEYTFKIMPMTDIPSPFAHGIILLGKTDVVQLADRTALLRELHQQVLSKVFSEHELKETVFSKKLVDGVFKTRHYKNESLPIHDIKQLKRAIRILAPIKTLESTSPSVYQLSFEDPKLVETWVLQLYKKRELMTIALSTSDYRSIPVSEFPLYWNIYVKTPKLTDLEKQIIKYIENHGTATIDELTDSLNQQKEMVKRSLKKLEQGFIVTHCDYKKYRGKLTWKYCLISDIVDELLIKQAKSLDPEECLKMLVERYLKVYGPQTLSEISSYLNVPEVKIQRALIELEQANCILEGHITSPAFTQYIRLEDRELLRQLMNRSPDELLLNYVDLHYLHYHFMYERFVKQNLEKKENVMEILNEFGILENLQSIAIRMKIFNSEWLKELINEGLIIQGRFRYGKIGYVTRKLFPYYYVVYREKIQLNSIDETILNTIEKLGPLTKKEIVDYTGLDEDLVKESLAILDRSLYVIRTSVVMPEHQQRRRFVPNIYDISKRYLQQESLPSIQQSREFIILQLVRSFGPVSIIQLTQISGLKYIEVESTIKSLLSKKKIVERRLTERETNYYMTEARYKEIAQLKTKEIDTGFYEKDELIIIPRDDPLTKLGIRAQLRDVFGDGFTAPILYNSKVIGSIEYKVQLGTYLQIYDMRLSLGTVFNQTIVRKLAIALISYARKIHHVYGVQIEDINGDSVLTKKNQLIREIFAASGYKIVHGVLVGGETITHFFDKETIFLFLLKKLKLEKYAQCNANTILDLVNRFGKLTYHELIARFPETPNSIVSYVVNQLIKENKILYQNKVLYSQDFIRYRNAGLKKRRRIKPEYLEVYRQIKGGFCSLTTLKNMSILRGPSLSKALEILQDVLYIAAQEIDQEGNIVAYKAIKDLLENKIENKELVKKQYLLSIIEGLGIVTEEQIVQRAYIPSILTKTAIRAILTQLLEEELLISGRFIEDSLYVYYTTKANYDELVQLEKTQLAPAKSTSILFLLRPDDFATNILSPFFPKHFTISSTAYLAIINCKIAAQILVKDIQKQSLIIENIIVNTGINSEQELHYLVNIFDLFRKHYFTEIRYISIQKINGFNTLRLVNENE